MTTTSRAAEPVEESAEESVEEQAEEAASDDDSDGLRVEVSLWASHPVIQVGARRPFFWFSTTGLPAKRSTPPS